MGARGKGREGSAGELAVKRSEGRVLLPGYLPRETLWAVLMQARCVLQLSHYEGFGLTVLEALAAGTPVIASRRGGLPEAGGEVAWLVDPDDLEATVETLQRVLTRGREIKDRQSLGRSYARSFTWEKVGRAVLNIYRETIGSRGESSHPS